MRDATRQAIDVHVDLCEPFGGWGGAWMEGGGGATRFFWPGSACDGSNYLDISDAWRNRMSKYSKNAMTWGCKDAVRMGGISLVQWRHLLSSTSLRLDLAPRQVSQSVALIEIKQDHVFSKHSPGV